jgi:hypothetical protein
LRQADPAEQALGIPKYPRDPGDRVWATDMLAKAAAEYWAALKFAPDDGAPHLGP